MSIELVIYYIPKLLCVIKRGTASCSTFVILPDDLEKVIIQGPIQGTRKHGRSKLRWTDGIKEMTGLSLNTARRLS